jgi:hypothetical protein
MSTSSIVESATVTLLRETFEGPTGPSTYFIDNDPKAGFFSVLDALSAAEASRPTRPGGPTIAGHAFHAGFHLETSSAWLRGDHDPRDWAKSWEVGKVDETAWAGIRQELRHQYAELLRTVETEPAANGVELASTIGAIAHAAYHLGAVRQAIAGAQAG